MPDDDRPPEIPEYELLRRVGRGAYGEVWLAQHQILRTFHAIKTIRVVPEDQNSGGGSLNDVAERVLRGLQLYLERLPPGKSPAIAITHVGKGINELSLYYVMELADDAVSGRAINPSDYRPLTLRELSRRSRGGCLPAADAIRLGAQLAGGLEALHGAGLVHRDIKPSNIVFVRGVPLLADIDLTRPSDGTLSIGGSPGYVPREGPGRPTGDIFAVGRTLYSSVTGLEASEFPRLPDDWDRRPDHTQLRELNVVLLRACDERPDRRFASAQQLMNELLMLEAGESVERVRRIERASRWFARTAAIAVPVALVASLIAWKLQRSEAEKSFALYRDDLNNVAANLARLSLGNARIALKNASNYDQTGIEIPLLQRQTEGDESLYLDGPEGDVDQIVFSGDGQFLAAASGTNAYLYPIATVDRDHARVVRPVAHLTNISILAGFLMPDHALVATFRGVSKSRPIGIWSGNRWEQSTNRLEGKWIPAGILNDERTVAFLNRTNESQMGYWQPMASIEPRWTTWTTPLIAHTNPIVQIDGLGQRLLLRTQSDGIEDQFYSHLYFGDVRTSRARPVQFDRIKIATIAVSGDGARAAYADSNRGEIVVGEFQEGFFPLATNLQHETRALAFSPNRQLIASGGVDQLVKLHQGDSLQPLRILSGHGGTITALAWSPDGLWLASGDSKGEIRLWRKPQMRTQSPTVVSGFKVGGGPVQIVTDADEHAVAFTSGVSNVCLMEIQGDSPQIVRTIPDASIPLLFSKGRDALWVLRQPGILRCLKIDEGTVLFETNAFPTSAISVGSTFGSASPDGRRLILYRKSSVAIWGITGQTANLLAESNRHENDIIDLAIRGDSALAVTVAQGGEAYLWSLSPEDAGKPTPILGITEDLRAACFVPESHHILLSAETVGLYRIDIRHPDRPQLIRSELNENYQMLATPDGKRILVAGTGGRIGVLRAKDGIPLVWFSHRGLDAIPGEHTVSRMLYLPKGERLLSLTDDGRLADW